MLVPEHNIGAVTRKAYVRIPSINPRTREVEAEYLGVVASGPFAEPDALAATAPTLVVAAAHGAVLTPKYHGIAQVEVFGERVDDAVDSAGAAARARTARSSSLATTRSKKVLGLNIPPEDKPVRLGLA